MFAFTVERGTTMKIDKTQHNDISAEITRSHFASSVHKSKMFSFQSKRFITTASLALRARVRRPRSFFLFVRRMFTCTRFLNRHSFYHFDFQFGSTRFHQRDEHISLFVLSSGNTAPRFTFAHNVSPATALSVPTTFRVFVLNLRILMCTALHFVILSDVLFRR